MCPDPRGGSGTVAAPGRGGTAAFVRGDAGCAGFGKALYVRLLPSPPPMGTSASCGDPEPPGDSQPPCSVGQMAQPCSGEGEIGGGFVGRTMSSRGRKARDAALPPSRRGKAPSTSSQPPSLSIPAPQGRPLAIPAPLGALQRRWRGDGGAGGMWAPRQAMLKGCGRGKGKGCGRDAGGS